MRRKLITLLLCLCLFFSLTGFGFAADPRLADTAESGAAADPADSSAGITDTIGILYRNQPAELVNAEGDILIEGNTFRLYLAPADASAYPALQAWIEDSNREREADLDAFIRMQTRDVYTQFENGFTLAYSRNETFIPVRADSTVLSFAVSEDTYLDGAHGVRSYESCNIDPVTGGPLSFSDIIADTEGLPDLLFQEIVTQNEELTGFLGDLLNDPEAYAESPARKSLASYVKEKLKNGADTLAWALDEDGVRFWFDDYSLGSYAAGSWDCVIRYADYPEIFADDVRFTGAEEGSADRSAVRLPGLHTRVMNTYGYDAVKAYAAFLDGYMEHPLMASEAYEGMPEDGEDTPASAEDVLFVPLYLDDDDVPELAVANGDAPWNPVHILFYDQEEHGIAECAAFSMYGKLYYEERTGMILPGYYIPAMPGPLFRFDRGSAEPYEAVEEHAFRPVFSEFRPMRLDGYAGEDELREALQRAAGLSYLSGEVTGIWQAETADNTYAYLEMEDENSFAVYDKDGYIVYMGMAFAAEDGLYGTKSYELWTPDGGLFEQIEWYMADDPLYDRIFFAVDPQSFIRYTDTGGGTPVRSPGLYLNSDILFLGEWNGAGSGMTLRIEQTDAMSGGYALEADLGNGLVLTGFAAPVGDELYITQAEIDGEAVGGAISREEDTIALTVTFSLHPDIEEGAEFTFSY